MNSKQLALTGLLLLSIACAKPKVELSVSKSQIVQGESVAVNWKTQAAKEVLLNGEKVAKSGTQLFQPTETTTYELIGRSGNRQARDAKTVTVEVAANPPTISLTAEPSAISRGEQARLRWATQNADRVDFPGIGTFGPNGELEVAPFESTTYTATARGKGGEATASARVTVTAPQQTSALTDGSASSARDRFEREVARYSIFFAFDKADLTPESIQTLNRHAQFLLRQENRSIVFRIEGNCDPRGSEEYNLALGDRRANAAKNYLISQGIDPARINVLSNGKRYAAGSSEGTPDNPPSWAHDRRDDFKYERGGDAIRP
ncbi:MAG: OmpA family protein [Acidobacteriota bacterium]|nr:OmpA family protein [Blastocatellia bacterium]MDW8411915.1 OmpA family protein [Acidobacteriota bacterium]